MSTKVDEGLRDLKRLILLGGVMEGSREPQEDVCLAFLAEIGELVNTFNFKWWGWGNENKVKVPKELSLPSGGPVWDGSNFFIEIADSMFLAMKLYKDKFVKEVGDTYWGIESFVNTWNWKWGEEKRFKLYSYADIKKLVVKFGAEVINHLNDPEAGVGRLIKFYKTFDHMARKITNGRGTLEDLMLGKLLLMYKRFSTKNYSKTIGGIEDNYYLAKFWYEGGMRYIVQILEERGVNEAADALESAFYSMLKDLMKKVDLLEYQNQPSHFS